MSIKKRNDKIKVGLVQINNSFDQQNYVPLSVGFLHSYAQTHAQNFDEFEFLKPIYKRIPIEQAAEQLTDADIVAFSTYVWNYQMSKAIAKRVKQQNPATVILFGGPHVPEPAIEKGVYNQSLKEIPPDKYDYKRGNGLENFLRENDFIDFAVTGEGEKVFSAFLESYPSRKFEGINSFHYLKDGQLISTIPAIRIKDLNEIPSPYLSGYFNSLIEENKKEGWIGLFETNRGCPFKCSFCDWGGVDKNKMADYNLEERIFKEIDWFSENNIRFVFCTDANFGMYSSEKVGFRDLRIAEKFAENKKKYGFPNRFSVQNTKNSTDASYQIQRVLVDSGLDQGVLLAFQSLNQATLEAVDRANIKLETYHELQKRFTQEGVTTFSDIILGLPLETYETFTRGISTLIENGQHNRIQINNLSLLPNAPMVKNGHIKKYNLEVVEADMINVHGSLGEWVDNIYEKQQLVTGTSTMPREEWVKARNFAHMTEFLHFDKVLQIPNIILNTIYGINYKEIIDSFIENPLKTQIIKEVNSLFSNHAKEIQKGGPEYIHSKQWLNIWWPADEYALITLATEGKLDNFYKEAESTLEHILKSNGYKNFEPVLSEALSVNRSLMKMPFQKEDIKINTKHNILDVYRAGLLSEKKEIEEGNYSYTINRSKQKWDSWEDWCREVIWWENKKGDYIYSYKQYEEPIQPFPPGL